MELNESGTHIAAVSAHLSKHCQDLHLKSVSQSLTILDIKEVK